MVLTGILLIASTTSLHKWVFNQAVWSFETVAFFIKMDCAHWMQQWGNKNPFYLYFVRKQTWLSWLHTQKWGYVWEELPDDWSRLHSGFSIIQILLTAESEPQWQRRALHHKRPRKRHRSVNLKIHKTRCPVHYFFLFAEILYVIWILHITGTYHFVWTVRRRPTCSWEALGAPHGSFLTKKTVGLV